MATVDDFPGNSKKDKETVKKDLPPRPSPEEKEIKKVVEGEVIQKKPGFMAKVKDIFVGGDLKTVASTIATDVLIPALKETVVNAGTTAMQRLIYGERGMPPGSRPLTGLGSTSRVLYNNPSGRYGAQPRGFLPGESRHVSPRPGVGDYILDSLADAEAVVREMKDLIDQYGRASLADLHALIGLPSTFVDDNWGWTSIMFFDIQAVRDGYLLRLPNFEPI